MPKRPKLTEKQIADRRARFEEVMAEQECNERSWAEKAGLTSAHLGEIKRGSIQHPASIVWTKAAGAYGLNPNWLEKGELPKLSVKSTANYAEPFLSRKPYVLAAHQLPSSIGACVAARLLADSDHETDPGDAYWTGRFASSVLDCFHSQKPR